MKMAQGRSRQEELLGHASLGHLGPPGLTEQGLVREFLTETHQVPQKNPRNVLVQLLFFRPVLRIRIQIHQIHMFLGLLDPNPDPLI